MVAQQVVGVRIQAWNKVIFDRSAPFFEEYLPTQPLRRHYIPGISGKTDRKAAPAGRFQFTDHDAFSLAGEVRGAVISRAEHSDGGKRRWRCSRSVTSWR